MMPLLLALHLLAPQSLSVSQVAGEDVRVRVTKSATEVRVFFDSKNAKGQFMEVASTPVYRSDRLGESKGFLEDPKLRVVDTSEDEVTIEGDGIEWSILVPKRGSALSVWVADKREKKGKSSLFALTLSEARGDSQTETEVSPVGVTPFERLTTPVAIARSSDRSFAIIPSIESLEAGSPILPVFWVQPALGTQQSVLSYGYLPFERNSDSIQPVSAGLDYSGNLIYEFYIVLGNGDDIFRKALEQTKATTGEARWQRPFPQMVPFLYYTKPTYDFTEGDVDKPGTFWQGELDGTAVGAPYSPDGKAHLNSVENLARFAWGMRWWGQSLEQSPWTKNADEAMNLVLTAQLSTTGFSEAFDVKQKSWVQGKFDVGAVAQTARYALRFFEDAADYAKKEEAALFLSKSAESLVARPLTGLSATFLQEFVASPAIKDESLKQTASQFVHKNIKELARSFVYSRADVESVALALALSRSNDRDLKSSAQQIIDRVFLEQAVWTPWTINGIDVFGSITGRHIVGQEQATFASDLFDAMILLGDQAGAERALRAARAPLVLFKHPAFSSQFGRLPEALGFATSNSWFGKDGLTTFGPEAGIASGAGQSLSTFAHVLDNYGSAYTHKAGWTICIDGLVQDEKGTFRSAFSWNPLAFSGFFPYTVVDARSGTSKQYSLPGDYPAIRDLTLTVQGDKVFVLAIPGFTSSTAAGAPAGEFVFADGTTVKGAPLATGFGAQASAALINFGPVSFRGTYGSAKLSAGPKSLLVGPPELSNAWPNGWKRLDGLADTFDDALLSHKTAVLSTGHVTSLGAIESVPFLLDMSGLAFTLLGTPTEGTFVELIDAGTRATIATSRKLSDGDLIIEWSLESHKGTMVVFRLVDETVEGWVGVKSLRSANVKDLP